MKFTTISNARKQTGLSYLGGVSTSAKIMHSQQYSHQYTYAIYLAPEKTSGYQVCEHSTKECRLGCLATSGRTAVEIYSNKNIIQKARIAKTKLFFEHREFFMDWMIAEIKFYQKKAIKDNFFFSVRLNATSDIDWVNIIHNNLNIFDTFSEVQFYDYTKNFKKFETKPYNYHLTFSYTGYNWDKCKTLLNLGFNVAVVFNVKREIDLPAKFNGFDVVNGDLTDFRVSDANSIIVGLKWKKIANKDNEKAILNSPFVVDVVKLLKQTILNSVHNITLI